MKIIGFNLPEKPDSNFNIEDVYLETVYSIIDAYTYDKPNYISKISYSEKTIFEKVVLRLKQNDALEKIILICRKKDIHRAKNLENISNLTVELEYLEDYMLLTINWKTDESSRI